MHLEGNEFVWPEVEPPEEDMETVPNPDTYMQELQDYLESVAETDAASGD